MPAAGTRSSVLETSGAEDSQSSVRLCPSAGLWQTMLPGRGGEAVGWVARSSGITAQASSEQGFVWAGFDRNSSAWLSWGGGVFPHWGACAASLGLWDKLRDKRWHRSVGMIHVPLGCLGLFSSFGGEFQQFCKNDLEAQTPSAAPLPPPASSQTGAAGSGDSGQGQRGLGTTGARLSPSEFTA